MSLVPLMAAVATWSALTATSATDGLAPMVTIFQPSALRNSATISGVIPIASRRAGLLPWNNEWPPAPTPSTKPMLSSHLCWPRLWLGSRLQWAFCLITVHLVRTCNAWRWPRQLTISLLVPRLCAPAFPHCLMLHRLLSIVAARSNGPGSAAWGPHIVTLTARLTAQLASCLALRKIVAPLIKKTPETPKN